MASFLISTWRHALLPLAWRLRSDGHEVLVVGDMPGYDAAFAGLFDRHGEVSDEDWEGLRRLVEEQEWTAVADSAAALRKLRELPRLFGCYCVVEDGRLRVKKMARRVPLMVGSWFAGGEHHIPHLLVQDVGTWTGGQGPYQPGGAQALWEGLSPPLVDLLDSTTEKLQEMGFQGLVRVSFEVGQGGEPKMLEWAAGWETLHMHLLLSAVEHHDLGMILAGHTTPHPEKRVSVALPVSIPPWPAPSGKKWKVAQHEIRGLTPEMRKLVGWHDMAVRGKRAYVAGIDGLVGVVRASANHYPLAARKVLAVVQSMQVPQLQWRMDAGQGFVEAAAGLEELGLVS